MEPTFTDFNHLNDAFETNEKYSSDDDAATTTKTTRK